MDTERTVPASRFSARLEQQFGVDVVTAEGDLDAYTVMAFRDVVSHAGKPGTVHVLVDLTRVGFLDSTGIAGVVSCRRRLELRRVELGLVVPSGSGIARTLRLVGLDQVIPMWPTLETALGELSSQR